MMIGVCGFGYSGSGALNDLLKEFNDVNVYDNIEFDFVYVPDGLEDLYYHLCVNPVRYLSSNTAIKRFINLAKNFSRNTSLYMKATNGAFEQITRTYIDSIIQVTWKGNDTYDKINREEVIKTLKYRIGGRIDKAFQNLFGRRGTHFSYTDMYLSVKPDNFIDLSRQYLFQIMAAMGVSFTKNYVLNQPFPSNNPEQYYKYYEDPIAIMVDRDPRDQYILAKKILGMNGSFIPTHDVRSFILYYRKTRDTNSNSKNCLRIHFENLVYEYETTIKRLSKALNITSHISPRKYFNPDISINNTQLFKRYSEYKEDILEIEKNLKDFLFDFDQYGDIKLTGKPF